MSVWVGYPVDYEQLLKLFDLRKEPCKSSYLEFIKNEFTAFARRHRNNGFTLKHIKTETEDVLRIENEKSIDMGEKYYGSYKWNIVEWFGCTIKLDHNNKQYVEFDRDNFGTITDEEYEDFVEGDHYKYLQTIEYAITDLTTCVFTTDKGQVIIGINIEDRCLPTDEFIERVKDAKETIKRELSFLDLSKIEIYPELEGPTFEVENPDPYVITTFVL
uniref:Uncharacterized protein n=1 Tax=viral metagenome TaxID=1070528 RepID=A0A6C0EB20_9ZZZZ